MSKSTPKSTPSCKGKQKPKITPPCKCKHLTTNHTILGKQIKKAHQIIKNVKAKHINTFTNICHLYQIRYQVLCILKWKEATQLLWPKITPSCKGKTHNYIYQHLPFVSKQFSGFMYNKVKRSHIYIVPKKHTKNHTIM